ncbi:MAG: hypothetical protein PHS62_00495 [Patescibacteria group bacterium]|nr:hypothetical protein [Patescibacteria group bacterium]
MKSPEIGTSATEKLVVGSRVEGFHNQVIARGKIIDEKLAETGGRQFRVRWDNPSHGEADWFNESELKDVSNQ